MCDFLGGRGGGKFTSYIATYVKIFTVGICYEAVGSTFHVVVFGNFQLITAKRTFAFSLPRRLSVRRPFPLLRGLSHIPIQRASSSVTQYFVHSGE